MHHLSLPTVRVSFRAFAASRAQTMRVTAAACALLAVSSLALPQRGTAQNDPNRSAASSDSGYGPYADPGYANDPNYNDPNYPASSSGDTNSTGNGSAADNGGDSAIGPDGGPSPNPSVGVDTTGRADAVATRNGRTTRRRPPAPANPLVITDPTRVNSPNASSSNPYPSGPYGSNDLYDPYGPNSLYNLSNRTQQPTDGGPNRLIPPVQTRAPGNYTIQTDPAQIGLRRSRKALPLFGYDFFQPARQIIVARRRALLPRVPRSTRSTSAFYSNSRSGSPSSGTRSTRRPTQSSTGGSSGYFDPSSSSTDTYPGTDGYSTGNGNRQPRRVPNIDQGNDETSGYPSNGPSSDGYSSDGYSSGGASGSMADDSNAPDSQTSQGGSDYPAESGSSYPASRRRTGSSDPGSAYPGDMSGSPDSGDPSSASGLSSDGSSDDMSGASRRRRRSSGSSGNFTTDPNYGDTNSGYPDPSDPNSYYGGASGGSGGFPDQGFPGDAATPMGSDIQFPGDDALVQSGSANAVTGQIADPVSTLYKNVLASLPPNYQLQPGDVLTVRYSALTLAPREFTATVDVQGGINVQGVGRIGVTGRTASQAEAALRQRLERLYRNVDVSINLRQLRTIQVTVSGAAFAPGTYTVPATATAFNVLNAAGGPTANGSLREIRVLRGGRLTGVLDIYPLIGAVSSRSSAKNGDISLQSGDNIYVPARLSRITVAGEVRQSAVYELTPAETLRDALGYAGGVKPSGVDQNVHIDTIDNGVGRVLVDVNLRDKPRVAATPLFDGDSVQVSSVRAILTNRVTVAGAVDQPGDYALTPGMRVTDLIQRARGPLYNAYLDRADLVRLNADNTTTLQSLSIAKALDGDAGQNVVLKRFDRLRLYSRQEVSYLGRRVVTVRGAVQRPGLFTQSDNMKVSDLLLSTGGPLPDAYLNRAVLLHQRGDGSYAYDYVNLRGIVSGNAAEDLPVLDNDVLAVYKIGEAHFTPDHTVKVLGDVVAPGLYARGEGMRLSDLLKLSGAFKPGGGTRVTVAHARRPVSEAVFQVASTDAASSSTTVAYTSDAVPLSGTDLVLQDGDVIAVQGNGSLKDSPAVVTVTGQVNRPGPILIRQGMRLSDAIREAGGLRPEAFAPGAEFTRMSDSLVTTGQLNLADVINQMSNMLNLSQYQRERAKANLALIQAAGSAASGSSSSGLSIPGLGGAPAGNAANPNLAPLIATLPQNNPVSPGRLLTPSQLQPNGGVAVRLAEALKRPGSSEDVLLKDGDTLVIPETPTTVQVVGAVFNARGVLYRPGQSIDYYIQSVGGFTPDAAQDRIEVIHAGGGLIPANKAGALQPGDLILVPTKVLAEKVGKSGSGFSDFFQGLVGSAITLKVLSSVFGL